MSDHRPKCVRLRKEVRTWRVSGPNESRVLKIKWEVLQDESKREEYEERTRVLMNESESNERMGEWERVSEIMVRAAKEVCGVREKGVLNPWVIGHEESIRERTSRVNDAVNERNECMSCLRAMPGVTTRRNSAQRTLAERRLERAKTEVKTARKEVKRLMRRIEREWWMERIN